eukprot:gene27907-36764_t
MSTEDIDDHVNELEAEHSESTRKLKEMHDLTLGKEKDNKYEHKLADQLEKYDRLSEKMQLLKQKCEGLLEAEKSNFTKQLNDVKEEAAFKEIVNQQEDDTLENFRFVLDHRLQQLSSERGPITSHIEGLERHISTMYEELVEEFNNKKMLSESDLSKTRQEVREREAVISQFKREIGNIVSSMMVGKELEECVRNMYKKFAVEAIVKKTEEDDMSMASLQEAEVKGSGDRHLPGSFINEVEEALVETAKEAERQKKFLEQQTRNLKNRLLNTKIENHFGNRGKLTENSNLLYECNDLRTEVIELKRELDMTEQQLKATQRKYNKLQREHSETTKTLSLMMTKSHLTRTGTAVDRAVSPNLIQGQKDSPNPKPGSPNRWVVNNALAKSPPRRSRNSPTRAETAPKSDNESSQEDNLSPGRPNATATATAAVPSFTVGGRKYMSLSQSAPQLQHTRAATEPEWRLSRGLSNSASVAGGNTEKLPSIGGGQDQGTAAGGKYFTNADIYGSPSEDDRNSLQLGPAKTQAMKLNRRDGKKTGSVSDGSVKKENSFISSVGSGSIKN